MSAPPNSGRCRLCGEHVNTEKDGWAYDARGIWHYACFKRADVDRPFAVATPKPVPPIRTKVCCCANPNCSCLP